eukprot:gene50287-31799_t
MDGCLLLKARRRVTFGLCACAVVWLLVRYAEEAFDLGLYD